MCVHILRNVGYYNYIAALCASANINDCDVCVTAEGCSFGDVCSCYTDCYANGNCCPDVFLTSNCFGESVHKTILTLLAVLFIQQ